MNTPAQSNAEMPPGPQGAAEGPIQSLVAVWQALRKYWSISTAVAIAVMLAVGFYTTGQTKIYRSSATIQVDPSAPKPLGKDVQTVVDMGAGDYFANREYLETQYKIIQSKRVARAVVERLGLHRDVSFFLNVPPRPGLTGQPVSEDSAAEVVRARLMVEPVKESRLANVRYEDASPERAQRILAAIIDTYISQNLDDTLASVNSAVDWLRSQLDKLKVDLESSEMALHDFKEQKNILALEVDDQTNILKDQLHQLNAALTQARTKRQDLAAKYAELLKSSVDDPRSLTAPEFLSDPLLSSLRTHYEDALRQRDAELGRNKGANHVDVRSAEASVNAARAAVLAEVGNIRAAAQRELSAAEKHEGGLSALLSEAQRRAVEVNLLEIQYNGLERARKNNEKLYSLVLERTKETDLQRLLRVNNLRIVDTPDLPLVPVRPRLSAMFLTAVLAGLAAALCVALGLSALDRTLKTPEEIEASLGLTCLGILPLLDDRAAGSSGYGGRRRRRRPADRQDMRPELVVHLAPASRVAEAARAVRTNLMFMSPDNPIRVLLVSSANPSEGKTTVACCIAVSIAQAGHRTLLVDCDLRRPRIHRIFGMSGDEGLTTALLDETALDRVIQPSEIPNLSVLPSGPIPPNPADLMHSERFQALIGALRGRFDRVILDSSPIAPVTDATILSAYVDATILVVRAFVTKKDLARHALRSINDIGSKTAGTVLNAVDFSRHEYKYASYYGRYGYGTPYGEPKNEPPAGGGRSERADEPHGEAPGGAA
jgi:capsular exopolysaccharide synthesis family protein